MHGQMGLKSHRICLQNLVLIYTSRMAETRTERSTCGFQAQTAPDGKPIVVVRRYQETISMLKGATVGFDLLGGTSVEQAKKLTELLNDRVIDIFLTMPETE